MLGIDIKYCMISIIIAYIPFHLFEEAMGNFPKWMKDHKWIPVQITYGHWMANNLFFYFPLLILAFSCYYLWSDNVPFLGVGILFWGLINCLDHMIYTIKDHKVSPGLFTGFIFAIIAVMGLSVLYFNNKLSLILIILSIIMGLVYAFLPVKLSMLFHEKFKNIFI